MTTKTILSGFVLSNQSSSDAVISVLSEHWPLSTKELFAVLKKEYGFSATYQALHKTLGKLVEQGVLKKAGSAYQLDVSWVSKVKTFSEKALESYSKPETKELASKDILMVPLENFLAAIKFIINDFYSKFPNPEKKPAVCLWEYTCCWVGMGELEYVNLKKMFASCPHYAISKHKTPLDLYFSGFLEKLGKHCFCGIDYNASGDIFVQGDYVCQVYYPAEYRKKLARVYKSTKRAEEFDPDAFFKLVSKPYKMSAVVSKNPEFADYLRKNLELLKNSRA